MRPNHLFRHTSLLAFATCLIAASAHGAVVQAYDYITFDTDDYSYIYPYESNYGSIRDNLEFMTGNGGLVIHSLKDASSATAEDGGVTLWGNPIRIFLESYNGNAHAASFEVSRGNAWQSFTTTPIFKIDALTMNSTFTGSNVAINGGSLSVGAGLTVTGNQTVSGTLSAGGSPVITAASAGSVLTGQNFVQLASGGVLNIASTSPTSISTAGGLSATKDSAINGITVGRGAGDINTNTVVGASALTSNSVGNYQTALGTYSLMSNTTGTQNTALGTGTLALNTAGSFSTAVGTYALYSNTGGSNTAVGHSALLNKTTGLNNIAVGRDAGKLMSDNTNLTFTTNSIFIGTFTKGATTGSTNSIVIGTSAISDGPNTTVIGNTSTVSTRLEGETKSESLRVSGNTVLEGDAQIVGNTVLGGNTVIEGSVTLAEAQGDISMGDYE